MRFSTSSYTPSQAAPSLMARESCGCTLLEHFLWIIWMERNNRLFNGKGSTFDRFFERLIFLAKT